MSRLTSAQRELLVLVIKGLTRRQMAGALGVREETVADRLEVLAKRVRGTGHALTRLRIHAYELLNANDGEQLGTDSRQQVSRGTTPNGGGNPRKHSRIRRTAR